MIRVVVFFGLFLALASGGAVAESVSVRWSSTARDGVDIGVDGQTEYLSQCIRSGFEARVRFELALCRRRQMWFDRCSDTVIEVHGLRYDAVTDAYTLTADTWGDPVPPRTETLSEAEAALKAVSSSGGRPLAPLGWEHDGGRYEVRLRAVVDCKGEYNELLARIPYLLTFGLIRVNGFDSGTVTFALDGQRTN